jgi:hypothetical protein
MVHRNSTSLCSTRATQRGLNQKIIAISFFGPVENPKMFSLNSSLVFLQELIDEMQQVYADDWILRVYHDGNILNRTITSQFEYHYDFIDFCNVINIGLDFIPPKIWRFLPAGDETVSITASRDLDSPLTKRERTAVDEWLLSNMTFHSMRDHPHHTVSMTFCYLQKYSLVVSMYLSHRISAKKSYLRLMQSAPQQSKNVSINNF